MNQIIIKELDKLINRSIKKKEVPVGAVIVKNNKIIAKAYNKRNKTNNILKHAEIIAINKASQKLRNWRLNECNLYTSLEPCPMCKKVIEESRIKNVYYILKRNEDIKTDTKYQQIEVENYLYYEEKLKKFFKSKR